MSNATNKEELNIDDHLRQALSHLVTAINKSIFMIMQNDSSKKEIGQKWESFLGQFFGYVRDKGKESRVNLMSLISFSRLRKW
ncbi:MAG TPA: hypothetical protein VJ824_07330 [Bacillota bacterium]|nr:hypothetical protein [Bacillota bacterium]